MSQIYKIKITRWDFRRSKDPNSPIVFWVSRHPPLHSQIHKLQELLGDFMLVQVEGTIPTAEHLLEVIKPMMSGRRAIIIPVLPLSMIARLSELSKKEGFELWFAEMKQIAQVTNTNEAQRIVNEKPEARTMTTYSDGTVKVFEFVGFKRIKQVKIELEDIE